ncbi:MAG: hypothetical protein K0V04_02000 [Deltaproteobacteria bacterium]|nr:hypothetical protein [Deltaproteobacteria bacterium]
MSYWSAVVRVPKALSTPRALGWILGGLVAMGCAHRGEGPRAPEPGVEAAPQPEDRSVGERARNELDATRDDVVMAARAAWHASREAVTDLAWWTDDDVWVVEHDDETEHDADELARDEALREARLERQAALREAKLERDEALREAKLERAHARREAAHNRAAAQREAAQTRASAQREAAQTRASAQRKAARARADAQREAAHARADAQREAARARRSR